MTRPDDGEVITTSETGGQKGQKLERYDLIPAGPLAAVARLYGKGAAKYDDHNWRRGYAWSLSFASMMRHAWAFWRGQINDDHEPGCPPDCTKHTEEPHLASVIFHAMALLEFTARFPQYDDRFKGAE